MEKSLSDILRERNDLTEAELTQVARFCISNKLRRLSVNQLDRIYSFVQEVINDKAQHGGL